MIVFGTAVTNTKTYERFAAPGIRRAAEPDSEVLAHHTAGSLFRNYNLLLDKAAAHDDLEALVLLHQDAEIADSDFASKVREAFSDADVAIVGCTGAVGVRSIAWWQGAVTWAGHTHRYEEHGGGDFPAISWQPATIPPYASPGEVDSIDGLIMVLSPWAVRELRFDESLGKLHGYDFDICMQARAAGKKVATAPFRVIHHHSLDLLKDPETWIQTHIRLAEKWDGQLPDTGSEPRRRALRAEAEAACARVLMVSHQMQGEAAKRHLERIKQELDSVRGRLAATRRELEAVRRDRRADGASSNQRAAEEQETALPAAKARAIDYTVEKLGIQSFASLDFGEAFGQAAFHTIDKPSVQRGVLVDARARRPRDHLLSAIEQAAELPGMEVLDGTFSDPETVTEIGHVDAVLLFDLLVRMVDPDWDRLLEMYAPATSAFVIANPQWEGGKTTVRLIDLGRERYLTAVPPWRSHIELFDRLDEWHEGQQRPYRNALHVWQWGLTDADLERKMDELGFSREREWTFKPPPSTEGFVNKSFVFARSDGRQDR